MVGLARRCALVAVVLAAVACKGTLRSGLSEDEANQIALALDAAQIASTKVAGPGSGAARFEVQVAPADMTPALRVLAREQLPQPAAPGFAELYDEGGLVATPAEERGRWAAATASELARSLERIAGVADARVHLAPGESPRMLDVAATPPKASVLIRRRPGAAAVDEAPVRALLAGAVEGLAPERVTVVQVASETGKPAARSLVQIGPIAVTRASAFAFKALLGGVLVLDLALAVGLVALWRVHRRAQHARDES